MKNSLCIKALFIIVLLNQCNVRAMQEWLASTMRYSNESSDSNGSNNNRALICLGTVAAGLALSTAWLAIQNTQLRLSNRYLEEHLSGLQQELTRNRILDEHLRLPQAQSAAKSGDIPRTPSPIANWLSSGGAHNQSSTSS